MNNLVGQSIGRYHILEQVGTGGMALVYKAYDTRLERTVALKLLRTEQFIPSQLEMVLQRFEREAKSLAKLSHPNIINILDYGEFEGVPYLVMPFMPGGTLKNLLDHAYTWQEAIRIILPVADGLAYAHRHGIIHRDVKPANIMFDELGSPILTDFGIAKLLETPDGQSALTGSGVGIGTPEYMAPEQGTTANVVDARADIYALGIVSYEMVTGRKPYTADTPLAVLLKQINDPLPDPRLFVQGLPQEIENILYKALAKQPDDRYQSMEEFINAFQNVQAEETLAGVTVLSARDQDKTIQAAAFVTLESKPPQPAPPVSQPVPAPTQATDKRFRFWGLCALIAVGILFLSICGIGIFGWLLSDLLAPPAVEYQPTVTMRNITATLTTPPATHTPVPPTIRPTETAILLPVILPYDDQVEADSLADLAGDPVAEDTWRVTVSQDQMVRFGWGWCATTEEILARNLEQMKYTFSFDGVDITDMMTQWDYISEDNWACHSYAALVESWPPGTHTLEYKLEIFQTINDGEADYEGTATKTYLINVTR